MGHGRGAHAVRKCLEDQNNNEEVVIAMLAIQLGRLDEAKQLYLYIIFLDTKVVIVMIYLMNYIKQLVNGQKH